jgi:hypothetical protein
MRRKSVPRYVTSWPEFTRTEKAGKYLTNRSLDHRPGHKQSMGIEETFEVT